MPLNTTLNTIIISRPDAIGDVILTFPMCGLIKKYYPKTNVLFLGKTYTKEVISCCEYVDGFINADDLLNLNKLEAANALKKYNADAIIHVFPNKQVAALAKKAKIKLRIGTTNRVFHLNTVNKLIPLSRKKSTLHEAQLNCKLLIGIGIEKIPSIDKLYQYIGFTKTAKLNKEYSSLFDSTKTNVILHPKSNASAREWGLDNFNALIKLLPENAYKIFISGTETDKVFLKSWTDSLPEHVVNVAGKFSLSQFIAFINEADVLIAASTGPLHIASACEIRAIGIYPPIKPMHPGRWQPIGKNASYLCENISCVACKNNPAACKCMNAITPDNVAEKINQKDS